MDQHYAPTVHWKTDDLLPLWQLRRRNGLRVDITSQFDAKFKITAICGISDEESNRLRELMRAGTIPCELCGEKGFMGYDDTIFKHTNNVGEGWGWHVTNNAMESPGFTKAAVSGKILNMRLGNNFENHVTKHPNDGYTVQFENVPWAVFKRYWRKPINLDRQFHGQKIKSSWRKNHAYLSLHPAVFNLHFDMDLLRKYKCIFVDFHRGGMKEEHPDMNDWMVTHARTFYTMSDGESPFVKGEAEFLFTTEWMYRIPR
jgi:hypothetical protein